MDESYRQDKEFMKRWREASLKNHHMDLAMVLNEGPPPRLASMRGQVAQNRQVRVQVGFGRNLIAPRIISMHEHD